MNMLIWKFNFFYSVSFWLFTILLAISGRFFGRTISARKLFLCLASILMLLAIPGFAPWALGAVIAMALLTYWIGSRLLKSPEKHVDRQRKLVAGAGIVIVLTFLAFFKYRLFQVLFLQPADIDGSGSAQMIRMIGVSYFSFRMIHFLIESYRNKIQNLDLLTYVDYITFFPAFISGPINRYNQFALQVYEPTRAKITADFRAGGERIVHGLFKKFVLAQLFYPHVLHPQPDSLSGMTLISAVLSLYAYALFFYFDFAGYTDLAIGCARLLGIELPENFNNPLIKRNIRELWSNWHMSLTSWLVDYIYWPIVRRFRSFDFFRRHPILLSNISMIITFIACGMWHGEKTSFILWGAYHGIGIALLTIYQREKRKARSAIALRYFKSPLSQVLGSILTFNFFSIGLALFVLDMEQLRILFTAIISGH